MGTLYYVRCRDCKKTRNLDKFSELAMPVASRSGALLMADAVSANPFRPALLCSFLWEHRGHNCVVFDEHNEALFDESGLADEARDSEVEDELYWRGGPTSVLSAEV